MALNYDNTRQLVAGTSFVKIDVDEFILDLPGAKRLKSEDGKSKRMRVAGMQKYIAEIPKAILEKLGFYVKDDNSASDENEKEEDVPF